MTGKRLSLWVVSFLLVGSVIAFAFLHDRERAYQAAHQQGWKTYLQEFASGSMHGNLGMREGEMLIDQDGNVWMVGAGAGLQGLHMFDGTKWVQQEGGSTDLAIGPDGKIWVVRGNGLDVFDGHAWKKYPDIVGPDIPYISQVEVDSNGRIWITANNFGTDLLAEVIIKDGETPSTSYEPQFTIKDGAIRSLDADQQGRVWAAISLYPYASSGNSDQLKVFDGTGWENVYLEGEPLTGIVRTTFDTQGRIWIATECGDVMMYSNGDWTPVVEEDQTSECVFSPQHLKGIEVDDKGRVWVWGYNKVRFLDGKEWTDLSAENSAIPEWIFGVVVDDRDQVWIGSSGGVSMAAVRSLQPLPASVTRLHLVYQDWLQGLDWFVPSILAILLITVYFDIWQGVLITSILGTLLTLAFAPANGYNQNLYPLFPGGIATYLGIFGGLVGGLVGRRRGSVRPGLWAIGFALLCFVLSAAATIFLLTVLLRV